MTAQDLVAFEDEVGGFESFVQINGKSWWYASDLARMLGYSTYKPFFKAIQKAMVVCTSLGIPMAENF